MTDPVYRRPAWKRAALAVACVAPVNRLLVLTASRLLPSELRHRIPVVNGSAVVPVAGNATITLANPEKCAVAREMYWGGGTFRNGADRTALDTVLRLSREASLFLDIGAYTGLFALAVARAHPEIDCHAYEIVPDNYLLLWQNVMENGLVGRVRPELIGIGAGAGTIHVPRITAHGVLPSSVDLSAASRGGVTIPVRSLDELYPDFVGQAVLKIDVEGFEWEVLRGAEDLIARVKPDIVCEVLRRAPNIAEMTAFLARHGYAWYHISEGQLLPRREITPDRDRRDWLFTARSASELQQRGVTIGEA
jgi:FkbM family methyltransferase